LGMPVGLAVAPLAGGQTQILGDDEAAHGWSTTKVPVLAALLRARGSHGLSGQELEWARSAITESDNASILSLFHDLEGLEGGLSGASSYVQQLLRDSGDTQTVVATAPPRRAPRPRSGKPSGARARPSSSSARSRSAVCSRRSRPATC
jgi:hypothetical protein